MLMTATASARSEEVETEAVEGLDETELKARLIQARVSSTHPFPHFVSSFCLLIYLRFCLLVRLRRIRLIIRLLFRLFTRPVLRLLHDA